MFSPERNEGLFPEKLLLFSVDWPVLTCYETRLKKALKPVGFPSLVYPALTPIKVALWSNTSK
jgi:hypothetical protein